VESSTDKPVIFTSINDGDFNPKSAQLPNPFDWNGIIVTRESGSVHMQNFQLRYSVYGIKSQNTMMTIQNGVFRQNGQFHFTMNDKIQYVQDNIPYSYNIGPSNEKPVSGAGKTEKKPSPTSASSNTRNIIRFSSLGVGVIGLVAGTVFALKASSSYDATQAPKYTYNDSLSNDWQNVKNRWHTENNLSILFFVLGGLGLAGFTATFVF
jgi:hypothetical protein